MLTLQTMTQNVYARLQTTQGNCGSIMPPSEILRLMNEEWVSIASDWMAKDPDLFKRSLSVTLVKDVPYALPAGCEIIDALYDGGGAPLPRISRGFGKGEASKVGYERTGTAITLKGMGQLALTLVWSEPFGRLHYGVFGSVDAGVPALAETPEAGETSGDDGYYTGLVLAIDSGPGAGQSAPITGYAGATRAVGLAAPFAVPPDATSGYAIMPPIPDRLLSVLELGAIARMPLEEWAARADANGEFSSRRRDLAQWIVRRASEMQGVAQTLSGAINNDPVWGELRPERWRLMP